MTSSPFDLRTPAGAAGLAALVDRPAETLLAFDFDGVLSPIVDDPTRAWAHPGVVPVLRRLAPRYLGLVIVTGRPALVPVELGRLAGVPELAGMLVLGQYGLERWDAGTGEVSAPPPDAAVEEVRAALPGLLEDLSLPPGTSVENKAHAVVVHYRRTPDPDAALRLLSDPLTRLASDHGLEVQPGRMVLELRRPGIDKGAALRSVVGEFGARAVLYAGDDLGDLPAFDAVESLRAEGTAGLLVCAGSSEVTALAERADLVVDGPAGVVAFLEEIASRLGA